MVPNEAMQPYKQIKILSSSFEAHAAIISHHARLRKQQIKYIVQLLPFIFK